MVLPGLTLSMIYWNLNGIYIYNKLNLIEHQNEIELENKINENMPLIEFVSSKPPIRKQPPYFFNDHVLKSEKPTDPQTTNC